MAEHYPQLKEKKTAEGYNYSKENHTEINLITNDNKLHREALDTRIKSDGIYVPEVNAMLALILHNQFSGSRFC